MIMQLTSHKEISLTVLKEFLSLKTIAISYSSTIATQRTNHAEPPFTLIGNAHTIT